MQGDKEELKQAPMSDAKSEATGVVPLAPTDPTSAPPAEIPADFNLNEDWLRDFYKECGREVTLAYTTLNQMKNWAIVIDGAIVAAVMATVKNAADPKSIAFAAFCGAAAGFVFTLRFFIRAILCYINLLRWNTLQSSIVRARLVGVASSSNQPPTEAERTLRDNIQNHYLNWRATINRPAQLLHNLKLGFALLLALPIPFLLGGGITLWSNPYVRAVSFFVVGVTLTELWDFLGSSLFDTPKVAAARKKHPHRSVFPVPPTRWGYVMGIALSTIGAVVVANWADLKSKLPAKPPQQGIFIQSSAPKVESTSKVQAGPPR